MLLFILTPQKRPALHIFKILCNKQLQSRRCGTKLMVTSLRYLCLEMLFSTYPISHKVNFEFRKTCAGVNCRRNVVYNLMKE